MALTEKDKGAIAEMISASLKAFAPEMLKQFTATAPAPAKTAPAPAPSAFIPAEKRYKREVTSAMVYSVTSFLRSFPVEKIKQYTGNSIMLKGLAEVEAAMAKSPIDRTQETGAQWAARMLPGISAEDFGNLCGFVKNGRKMAADGVLPGAPVVKSGLHRASIVRWR